MAEPDPQLVDVAAEVIVAKTSRKKTPADEPAPPAAPTPAEPPKVEILEPVPDSVVGQVYVEIRNLQRDATVALASQIGALLVERFFGGDLEAARSRGGKDNSLRKLAEKFEADGIRGFSTSGLSRYIAIHELNKQFGVATLQHLSASHIHAVLGLRDAENQQLLLTQANEEGWTVAELRDQVEAVREKSSDGRGRPALPAWFKTASFLGKLARQDDAFADMDGLDQVEDGDVQAAFEAVARMRERLEEVERTLSRRLKT